MFRTILGYDQASSVKNTEINKQSQSSGAIWGETGKGAFTNYVCIFWHLTTYVPPLVCTFYVVNLAFF